MRGSAAFRTGVAPGGALAGPWVKDPLWRNARAVPSLDLNFAGNKSLVDSISGQNLITFTRSSSGTYVGSDGLLKAATTNLLIQSNQFDTIWTNTNSTETATSGAAPDGTNTAWQLRDTVDASTVVHSLNQTVTFTAATAYTFSVWGKAGTLDRMALIFPAALFTNATARSCSVLFTTGAVSTGGSPTSASAVQFPNGWWRVSITATVDNGVAAAISIRTAIAGGSTYQGDGNGTILVWGAQLEQSSTVGEYIPTTSTINSAPRFDHNPTTGESLGLLVEEQRTNLLQRSEEFDNAYWTKGGSTISANSATAPDGLTTADKLVEDTSTGNHRLFVATTSLAANTAHSLSVYVKAAGRTFIRVEVRDSVGAFAAQDFNLTTLAITTAGSGTGTISSLGNGWYRCTVTGTSSASGGLGTALFWALSAPSGTSYTGDGTSGLLLWGAQLEAGAFPTSYIPTTTATATRSADVASITGTNFSLWYNSSASTLYSEAQSASGSAYTGYVYTLGADFNNAITHYRQSDFQPVARIRNAGVDEYGANGNGAIWTGTSVNKFALAISPTSGRQASNGSLNSSGDDSSITAPSASSMTLGALVGTSNLLNGTIRRLTYWPARLANSTLQAITQ